MCQQLAPADLRQSLFYFIDEPLVVVYEALYGFACQPFGVTSAFSGNARELGLHIGAEGYFHTASLDRAFS